LWYLFSIDFYWPPNTPPDKGKWAKTEEWYRLGRHFYEKCPERYFPGKKGPSFFQSLYYVPLKLLLTFYRIIVKWGEVISMWKLGARSIQEPFWFLQWETQWRCFFWPLWHTFVNAAIAYNTPRLQNLKIHGVTYSTRYFFLKNIENWKSYDSSKFAIG